VQGQWSRLADKAVTFATNLSVIPLVSMPSSGQYDIDAHEAQQPELPS
jgi:hypothetical protein